MEPTKRTAEEIESLCRWIERQGELGYAEGLRAHIAALEQPDPYTVMVREFHQQMGLVVRDTPNLGTPAEREERVELMLEELLEMARALGVSVLAGSAGELEMDGLEFYADGNARPNLADALHELADLQVTVSGTAVQFGLPLLAATREVHAANMEKAPQGPGRKPLKPDEWKPADVSKVLPFVGPPPMQLVGCDRSECRPFAVEPCACGCACHEVTP